MADTLNSVKQVTERLGIKETSVKKLIRDGALLSVSIGDRRLVPSSATDAYIAGLIATANDTGYTPGPTGRAQGKRRVGPSR